MNRFASLLLPVTAMLGAAASELPAQNAPAAAKPALSSAAYAKLPLSFEAVEGQAGQVDGGAQFLAHGQGYTLNLRPDAATLALYDSPAAASNARASQPAPESKAAVIGMRLLGADPRASATEEDLQITRTNYLIGDDPRLWRTGIPNYGRVRYQSVYAGIDLVYYGHQRQLEYDFVVAPHANPRQIRLEFNGADSLALASTGDLTISADGRSIALKRPVIYQQVNGRRVHVDGDFELAADHTASFRLGSYNRALPLVIDPKIEYSTFYGFATPSSINAIALDALGDLYFAGSAGAGLAVVNPFQATAKSNTNGFVAEINPTGTAILYATYLGGSGSDWVSAIALDASGNIYVAGSTTSSDFPVKNPILAPNPVNEGRAFVAELAAGGASLVYSTHLGGSGVEAATAVAVDAAGNAYVGGNTTSTDFPTVNPIQATYSEGTDGSGTPLPAGFVSEVAAGGGSLVYSTYLGGTGSCDMFNFVCLGDGVLAVAVDASGNAYIAGATASHDFPVANAIQSTNTNFTALFNDPQHAGPNIANPTTTGFVSKIQPGGGAFVFSTYLGGSGACYEQFNNLGLDALISCSGDSAAAIVLDAAGNAYIAGSAGSPDYPLYKAFKRTGAAVSSGFISVLKPDGSAFLFSTYFGGSGICLQLSLGGPDQLQEQCAGDGIAGIGIDPSKNIYVTGYAASPDFPTLYPLPTQTTNVVAAAGNTGNMPFVASLKAGGQSLVYSTYLGGSNGQDTARAIAVDAAGDAYVSGVAGSTDFPTYLAIQGKNRGNNPFITKISLAKSPALRPVITPAGGTYNSSQSVRITGTMPGTIYYTLDGSTPTNTSPRYTGPIAVRTPETVKAVTYAGGYAYSVVVSATYNIKLPAAAPVFSPPAGTYATSQSVKLTSTTPAPNIYYTTDGSTPTNASTRYTGPIVVATSKTIKAITYSALTSGSPVASAAYRVNLPPAPAPGFSVKAGTYTSAQSVKLTDSNPHATVYYTTDGSTPTMSSAVYSAAITVSSTETIKAVAHVAGYALSPVASATYTLP